MEGVKCNEQGSERRSLLVGLNCRAKSGWHSQRYCRGEAIRMRETHESSGPTSILRLERPYCRPSVADPRPRSAYCRAVRQAISAWSDPTTPADPRPRSAPTRDPAGVFQASRSTRKGIARSKLTPYQWSSSVALIASQTTSAASAAASSAVLPRSTAPAKTDA